MRIGLISDTHQPSDRKSLWEEVKVAFAGADLILHAGDIVEPVVLDWLEEIAPVLAARGNNDFGWRDPRVEDLQLLDLEGYRLAMTHEMPENAPIERLEQKYLKGERADIIVTGHTHVEFMRYRDGVLQLNPGSATLPHLWSTRLGTIGVIDIGQGKFDARIIRLGELPSLRNPGVEFSFSTETGVIQ